MNVVFISPHFPPNWTWFCHALADAGANVLGIGDSPVGALSEDLRDCLADYLYIPDMQSRDAMTRACGLLTARHGKLDRIDSLNEHWLEIEAQLRRDFNVFGLKPDELGRLRSKHGMREIFKEAGIPCARGRCIATRKQARAFVEEVGGPVVFKPELGVGGMGALRIDSVAELEDKLPEVSERLIGEEFLQGKLMSYDGLVDREGRILFEHCTEVSAGVMEILKTRREVHYYSLREPPAGLVEIGRSMIEAFGLRERFFHSEAFMLPDGTFRALEVNLRPPGGFSTDMMNFSFDADVYQLWARVMTRGTAEPWTERHWHVAHVGRRDHLQYRYDLATIHANLDSEIRMSQRMPAPFDYAMGDHVLMIRNKDLDTLKADIALIEALAE